MLVLQEGYWGVRGALTPSGTCAYQGIDLIYLVSLISMTQHAYLQVFHFLKNFFSFVFTRNPQRFAIISKASLK